MMKIKKIVSMLLSVLMLLSLFTVNVMAENSSEDIRFDFFTGKEGVSETATHGEDAESYVSDGVFVVKYNKKNSTQDIVQINTSAVDLGEGGYYVYAKVKTTNNNSNTIHSTEPYVMKLSGDSYTSTISPQNTPNIGGEYGVVKFDITAAGGSQSLRFNFKQRGSTTGDLYIYVDWIVISKSATVPAEPEMPTVAPDIRFDFTAYDEDASVGGTKGDAVKGYVADGAYVVEYDKGDTTTQDIVQINTPARDLGEGGYYVYAKVKTINNNGNTVPSDAPYVMKLSGDSYTSTISPQNTPNIAGEYDVIKFDITDAKGSQALRFNFKQRGSTKNVLYIYVDWIVISKSATVPTEAYLSLDSKIEFDGTTWSAVVYGEMEHAAITQDARVYFAGYNDAGNSKTLEAVNLTDITFVGSADSKNETINITKKLTIEDPDIKYVKVFVWDLNYVPLCNVMIPKE